MKPLRPRTLLFATSAFTVLTGTALALPNLAADPSFELTTLTNDPWSPSVPPGNSIDVAPGDALSGTHSLAGSRVGSQAFNSQTINLQPGIYEVSMNVRDTVGPGGPGQHSEYSAQLGGATQLNVVDLPADPNYRHFSNIVAAPGGPTTFTVGIRQDPFFGNIDDVAVVLIDDGKGNNIGAASQTVAAQMSREFMDNLFDRFGHSGSPMEMASTGNAAQVASNDGMMYVNGPGSARAFISVFGDHARWDSGDVRSRRIGGMLGAEWAPCDSLDLGFAIAVGQSHFRTETLLTLNHGEARETAGALFADWSPWHSSFYLTGIVGYGRSSNDFTRASNFGFGKVAAGGVDSTQWFGGAEIGFDFHMRSRSILTPFARIDGARVDQDAYVERNVSGGLVPAVVDGKEQTAGRTLLGLRAATELDMMRYPWLLTAKAAWQHEFDRDRSVTFSETAGGVTFFGVASGAEPVEDSAAVGASLEAPLNKNASLYLGYNGNFGSGQEIHAGEAGFRVTW